MREQTELVHQMSRKYLSLFKQWFVRTPERSLLEAYQAAQNIKNIETEHFQGKKISPESGNYSENVMSFWLGSLNRNLTLINVRLAEFWLSRNLINSSEPIILEQLKFIDEVITKYNSVLEPIPQPVQIKANLVDEESYLPPNLPPKVPNVFQKTGVLPRSIGRTINRIIGDFSPQAEEKFIKNYRNSSYQTRKAIKFLLILIVVPLLTQQLSKQLLLNTIVDPMMGRNMTHIFLNADMQEEGLRELKIFEEKLKFQSLLHKAPRLTSEEIESKLKERAIDIAEEFQRKSSGAVSNVFADLLSLVAFGIVVAMSKKEIVIVKSFIDEIVYGLSDSAKAFVIILFTDIFVGFHSPEGWEVIMEKLAEHVGLPADRSAIFLFIATFPVILDAIFKYWIFRYLSRLSPSSLATMKEMKE